MILTLIRHGQTEGSINDLYYGAADIPVLPESSATLAHMRDMEIQEVVFAIPNLDETAKKCLFETYAGAGYKVKIYDVPTMQNAGEHKQLREFLQRILP